MRRGVLPVVALLGLTALLVASPPSSAKAVPCFSSGENLVVTPNEGVTLNGLIVRRGASGFYETDGGLVFDVNGARLSVKVLSPTCAGNATSYELTTSDPFAGPDAGTIVLNLVAP